MTRMPQRTEFGVRRAAARLIAVPALTLLMIACIASPALAAPEERRKAFRFGVFLSDATGSGVVDRNGVDVRVLDGEGLRLSNEWPVKQRFGLVWNFTYARHDFKFNKRGAGTEAVINRIDSGSIGALFVYHPVEKKKLDVYFGPGLEMMFYGNVDWLPGTTEEGDQPSLQAVAGLDLVPWKNNRIGLNFEIRYGLHEIVYRNRGRVNLDIDPLSFGIGIAHRY